MALLAVPLLAAGACGSGDPAGGTGGSAGGDRESLTVFAAASLTDTFSQLARRFEAAHAGVDVRLSFAGSSDLVAQVEQGAPADVVATADEANMAVLEKDGLLAGRPSFFATNTLEIAVPPGNAAGVTSLQDLADPDLNLVVCAPEVPCGAAAQAVAARAGVSLRPDSEEQSVTDVLGKVRTGEADAGLVYVTDVKAAGDAVQGVPFPGSAAVVNRYPIAVVGDTDRAALARELVGLVLSRSGQRVLTRAGFGSP